ncbi:unnamed protein product, partial [Arabidopsis halleri]
ITVAESQLSSSPTRVRSILVPSLAFFRAVSLENALFRRRNFSMRVFFPLWNVM